MPPELHLRGDQTRRSGCYWRSFLCLKDNWPKPLPLGSTGDLCQVIILPFSPIPLFLKWPSCCFVDLIFLFMKSSLFLPLSLSSYPISQLPPPTHPHTVIISIGNEEEGIGIESHADWLAWGWKANYSLFLTTTSDVIFFAVKALTGCTLNILAICPIRFCSSRLKPFKDSAACHFRADWLPNAHIWNTWFQY